MTATLPICGINKTSLLDYPEHVATTIFLGGCNFRCPFCHNSELISNYDRYISFSEDEVLSHLERRKNILSGVCISGGEPTLHPSLPDFIQKIKVLGYQVKLDTNGTNPDMLRFLIDENLIDYVAMDIKADKEHYAFLCGYESESALFQKLFEKILSSISVLQNANIAYEFRTTYIKELHNQKQVENICTWLDQSMAYYLQNFEMSSQVLASDLSSFPETTLKDFQAICSSHFKKVSVRGIS